MKTELHIGRLKKVANFCRMPSGISKCWKSLIKKVKNYKIYYSSGSNDLKKTNNRLPKATNKTQKSFLYSIDDLIKG